MSESTCPSCGYCKECGRGGHYTQPYGPYWYYQPYWNSGGYVPTVTTGTVTVRANSNVTVSDNLFRTPE